MTKHLCTNKTNFHIKGFALGFAFKQRQKESWKLSISISAKLLIEGDTFFVVIINFVPSLSFRGCGKDAVITQSLVNVMKLLKDYYF